MRAKEFGLWKSRAKNANSGMSESGDPFNRALKGQPYQRPSEYNNTGFEEYHRYPEFRDLEYEEEEKKQQQSDQNKDQSKNSKNSRSGSGRATSRVAQNIVGRVVALSVGAIMVANSYEAMGGELPFELPFSFISSDSESGPSTNWKWSDDHTSVVLELTDGSGAVIKEIAGTVDVAETEPTCTEEGTKTYTASAEDEEEGKNYSETYTETTEPLGHDFGDWEEVTSEDGKTSMVSECSRCSEKFVITTSVEENDE